MKYRDVIAYERQGSINMQRVISCTRNMAEGHIDGLAEDLISAGIFTNASKVGPGKWTGDIDLSRIYNHDETPQFINFGVDSLSSGKVFGGVGGKKLVRKL